MKNNIFDQNLGQYQDPNMGGFLSDIAGKVRDAGRKVRDAVKKVAPKPLVKVMEGVESAGRKLEQSGITKVAAGLAVAWVAAPLAIGAVSSAASAVGGSAAFGAIKTGAVALAKSKVVGTLATTAVNAATAPKVSDPEIDATATANANEMYEAVNAAIAATPAFAATVAQARADGYSDEEIYNHWVTSRALYETAVPQITQTIQPEVYQTAIDQGFGPEFAEDYSYVEADRIAKEAMTNAQNKNSGVMILPALAMAAYFFF